MTHPSEQERLARELHGVSHHAADGAGFGSFTCDCDRRARRVLSSDWLAERVRLAQEQAWNEGHATGKSRAMRYMSDEPELKDWGTNPYTQGDKQA